MSAPSVTATAENIYNSVIIQGNNHGVVIVINGGEALNGYEAELLKIFRKLDIRSRNKLMGVIENY
jgi:hypothetical protein